ncbi:decaprenyl-phosphate phosphoribosyltransferase [Comamonas piscis]
MENHKLFNIIRLLRPHQWIKNNFVLVGVVFGFQGADANDWLNAIFAFVAFCLSASAVYIFNDMHDVELDRLHPRKSKRPLASGVISRKEAIIISCSFTIFGCIFAWLASPMVVLFVVCYLTINIFYTYRLKNIAVVDVFCISCGFMLRLLAGTVGIGISPTGWLLITGMMITLLLGFGKRRSELASGSKEEARKSLKQYSIPLLDTYIAICAAATIIAYSLYTLDSSTINLHQTSYLILTTPVVMFGIFRYLHLIHSFGKGQDTSKDLLTDVPLLITAFVWCLVAMSIMYFHL